MLICARTRLEVASSELHWQCSLSEGNHGNSSLYPPVEPAVTQLATGDILLEVADQLDNWPLFLSSNNVTGWTAAAGPTACEWDRVQCDSAGRITTM